MTIYYIDDVENKYTLSKKHNETIIELLHGLARKKLNSPPSNRETCLFYIGEDNFGTSSDYEYITAIVDGELFSMTLNESEIAIMHQIISEYVDMSKFL